jgi:hypothetical protein
MALVNPQLQKQIEELFPLVVVWVEQLEKEALEKGEPVLPPFEATAEALGIRQIDKIRVWKVDTMPTPENPQIPALAERFGLSIADSGGLTLGHAILVLRSQATRGNLLAHELVHVRQYEQAGSISLFLKRYVAELVQFEYENMPLEREATREAAKYFAPWQ